MGIIFLKPVLDKFVAAVKELQNSKLPEQKPHNSNPRKKSEKKSMVKATSEQSIVTKAPVNTTATAVAESMKQWIKRRAHASKKLEKLGLTWDNAFFITASR